MSQAVNKSAISVLDEFCKRKLQPPAAYTFISDESTSHFVCTVKCFNETKTGTAKSKQKAKNAAAQNLINQLRSLESFKFDLVFLNVSTPSVEEAKVTSSTTNENKSKVPVKSAPEINYVGKLLEYCTKNRLPPATFELIENTASSQSQSGFSMKCTVNKVVKLGTGSNKKQTKRMAAMEVLLELEKSTPKNCSQFDEPPQKRLKTSDKAEDGVTSSPVTFENIVLKTENKETPKENPSSNLIAHLNNSDDSDDDYNDGNRCTDDDCEEIIDTSDVFSVESSCGSDQTFEDD